MAAGQGFKTFTTGEVLTAGDVNGYLMQGVLVFASAAARDAAITSPQEGQFAFTKDTNGLWYYDGAAWVASGATGDIEGVTAGIGISGGGTSGTVTVTNSMATAIDAKGDLVAGTGADTFAKLTVGANGTTLVADSAEATGLKWATPAAGGMTLLNTGGTTLSGATTTVSSIDQTYKNLQIVIVNAYASSAANNSYIQFNSDTGNNYGYRFNNSGAADQGSGTLSYLGVMGASQGYYDGTYINITIPRYSETEYKSTIYSGTKGNNLYLGNNSWNNTAAITSITIGVTNSQTMSGGTMYIYGVK